MFALAGAAQAQESYVIGMSAALTGPGASTVAGAAEGLRLYVDRLNKAGGVNGRPITLILQDDQSEPSKAAANAKKLLTQDNVSLLINTSLSSTFAPMIAEAQRVGVPLLFAGSVCPSEVYPPANEFLFCTTSFSATHDARATIDFIKQKSNGAINIGLAAMAIPVSRLGIDAAEKFAAEAGMKVIGKEVIPPATADYTPFATKIMQGAPDWVYCWAPWITEIKTFGALRKLGWNGSYALNVLPETEGELAQIKDGELYALGSNAMFFEGLAVQKEISRAAREAGSTYKPEQMTDGWIGGMAIEATLRSAGWPTAPTRLKDAMSVLKVDTKGLRGGPIEWTKDNHFRTRQYYRVYRWNPAENSVQIASDWKGYDIR
ncbi:ABC transporter substrate-binding protein [Bradyrhizobium liaoningense]|uniref:ABC transporter substrate-binding protein n=1 Tax=Bradyrhizobium liaoningense TaxID=43992 RepID=UPI001BA60BDA|nr:ABC transporter substrate-binding protein [Bradyrhizobium liaoningense]MBR0706939.1 ABC transporter substrate-binding protein [Bradyrhizobium liaoningense]